MLGVVTYPTYEGPRCAIRLYARMRRYPGLGEERRPDRGLPETQVSRAEACAAGATLLNVLSRVPEPVHREPQTGKPDAGEPPVRFGREGGASQPLLLSSLMSQRQLVDTLAVDDAPITHLFWDWPFTGNQWPKPQGDALIGGCSHPSTFRAGLDGIGMAQRSDDDFSGAGTSATSLSASAIRISPVRLPRQVRVM